ncbi:unnamed protein product [Litomosoides sigmodontis]|uniref:Uncharacterized protein n=1 Tax=Litomosoides sigmodontis TaxID=42156 RepID=A0A3P6T9R1_LITSI|nr:unnamed protein product [Litomosoides sigmodontis]
MNTYVQQLKEEYEKRLRVSERSLQGEKERRRQLGFHCKQLEAQLRKVQRDNESMGKQLKILKKCSSCSHLDQRSKSYNALTELLRGSMAALEPDAVASATAPSRIDELKAVKIANNDLQLCVDKLQNMLLQKGREALAAEKYYNDAISEREEQISRLQKELQERWRRASTQSVANQHTETKLKALLKERAELLNRVNRLEKENKENYNVVYNESQSTRYPASAPEIFEADANPYCGYCRNQVKNWDKMMSGKMNSTGLVSSDRNNSNWLKEKMAAEEKIQQLSLALEVEKSKNKELESALKNGNDNLSSSYHKLLQKCESLETELGKRRIAETSIKNKNGSGMIRRYSMHFSLGQDGYTVSKIDVQLVSQLNNELDEAGKKIAHLENELSLAKRTIYENGQFAVIYPRRIEILEKDKKELKYIIDNQTEQLTRFDGQLRLMNRENEALQRKYAELERTNNLTNCEKLEQLEIIEKQRKELSRLEESQIEKSKAHDAQIEAYQQLIKQKDNERGALITELCAIHCSKTPLHDSINAIGSRCAVADENYELLKEVRELNHDRQAALDKVTSLESELHLVKDQLRLKTDEVEKEVLLKNSIHDDLAKARTMLLEKEAQILDLNNQLKIAEVKIMTLETELANSTDRLETEQITGSSLKITVEELEDLLQEKSAELIAAAQERQRCTTEMQKMKELKYDLETKLTLQGRELKEVREKLAVLRMKIRELELEVANSPDKSLRVAATQQEGSKSTLPPTTATKSAISTTFLD